MKFIFKRSYGGQLNAQFWIAQGPMNIPVKAREALSQ